MTRSTLDRAALTLCLLACLAAEAIPLMFALVVTALALMGIKEAVFGATNTGDGKAEQNMKSQQFHPHCSGGEGKMQDEIFSWK